MEKALEKLKNNSDTESTAYPFWVIIEPRKTFGNIHEIAAMVTGVFFSRKDAQNYLEQKSYNFSKKARVYCHSGHQSEDWKSLFS